MAGRPQRQCKPQRQHLNPAAMQGEGASPGCEEAGGAQEEGGLLRAGGRANHSPGFQAGPLRETWPRRALPDLMTMALIEAPPLPLLAAMTCPPLSCRRDPSCRVLTPTHPPAWPLPCPAPNRFVAIVTMTGWHVAVGVHVHISL